jgi:hypothetical protein
MSKKVNGVADQLSQPEIASARSGSSMRHAALSGFARGSTRSMKYYNGYQRGSTEVIIS